MERKEVNGRIYHLSHRILDGLALELTMRSLLEVEKNIWRLDLECLREEIKTSYFYAPAMSSAFMDCLKGRAVLSEQVRCQLLLGLVVRNPHWSVVEEEFMRLYGALQMEPFCIFSDYLSLRDLYCFQHRGGIKPLDLADSLEAVKAMETKRLLSFYQPAAWAKLDPAKQAIRVEKARIRKIQEMMTDPSALRWLWMEEGLKEADGQAAEEANRWRAMIDQLQRRERTGVTNADIRTFEAGQTLVHQMLGPVKVVKIKQEQGAEVWELKGLLRTYCFRYEKKR